MLGISSIIMGLLIPLVTTIYFLSYGHRFFTKDELDNGEGFFILFGIFVLANFIGVLLFGAGISIL